ncbi:hypothetical protein BGZ88_001574, partial [Linnemannia elongata]
STSLHPSSRRRAGRLKRHCSMQIIVMQSQPSPRWREVALSWMDPRSSVLTGKSSSKTRSLTRHNSH